MPAARMPASSRPRVSVVAGRMPTRYPAGQRVGPRLTDVVVPATPGNAVSVT